MEKKKLKISCFTVILTSLSNFPTEMEKLG